MPTGREECWVRQTGRRKMCFVTHDPPHPAFLLPCGNRTMSVQGKQQPRGLVTGQCLRIRATPSRRGVCGKLASQKPVYKRISVTQFPPSVTMQESRASFARFAGFSRETNKQTIVCNLPDLSVGHESELRNPVWASSRTRLGAGSGLPVGCSSPLQPRALWAGVSGVAWWMGRGRPPGALPVLRPSMGPRGRG